MGCFPCFDSRVEEKLNPQNDSDGPKEVHPAIPSNFSRLSYGADRLKTRSNVGSRKESSGLKDMPDVQIAAQTFTFRELAAATNNFRASDYPREYDGACLQMRLSYSPCAHIFLFLVQWTDCHLAGILGFLRILIYKAYEDGKTSMSVHEGKATIKEFYSAFLQHS
ncbi:serine/threonine-protein kinase PBS1-like isoform X2 [Coffea arabica]|uniref:Serine/threonine-protein kinase PBS1-like isoform X2 n=1 Tax=Coffea arabica TaxID=13443 RepID=A0ABM4WTK7_COFAR|nr:serine/threonine-protein kinase PBS1-like isoform X2 [Coffea arabica]